MSLRRELCTIRSRNRLNSPIPINGHLFLAGLLWLLVGLVVVVPFASLCVVVLVGSYCCCALSSIMKLFGRSGKSSESPITAPVEATSPPINNQEDQNIGGGGSGFFRKRLGTGSSLKSDVEDEGIVLVDSNPSSSYTAMKDEKSKTSIMNNTSNNDNNNNNIAAADETVSVVSDGDLSSHVNALKRMASSVLPKVAPLPAKAFFCLTVWCAIP